MKNARAVQERNINIAMENLPNIAIAQINLTVGDLDGNSEKIINACKKAQELGADLVTFPELAISGYPPEDLLYRPEFIEKENQALMRIAKEIQIPAVIGALFGKYEDLFNAAYFVQDGKAELVSTKQNLPNYGVFDERRYFTSGDKMKTFEVAGTTYAVLICEDGWTFSRAVEAREKGAEFLISINASPYEAAKYQKRLDTFKERPRETGLPLLYSHMVGGQDTVVFDGASFIMDEEGEVVASLNEFEEIVAIPEYTRSRLSKTESRYRAMVLGLRDYVHKTGFEKVLLGLSGGIDSALVAVIAVDALGAENVRCVMLPSVFTSQESFDDAEELARDLGIDYEIISIEAGVEAVSGMLADNFAGTEQGLAEENVQSRLRGLTLMAISNKHGELLLSTGNKSEMAVGYATLYGDMNGSFNPIKDLYKTEVFEVAKWCERISDKIINKEPTAELREGQKDSDSLPPYDVLDTILMKLVEDKESVEDIVADGFDREVVEKVTDMLYKAEYKRFQSCPGPKLSATSFGKDWRYPLTNKFNND